jgi:hypothetical protein
MSQKGVATMDVQRVRDVVFRVLSYQLVVRQSRMYLGWAIRQLACVDGNVRTRAVALQFHRQPDHQEG